MRLYFDIENNPDHRDPFGEECRTQAKARKHAREVAKRLASQEPGDHLEKMFVVVTGEAGREVFRLPVQDVATSP